MGGGISGLSLSYFLKRRGISSLILERSSRLGGNIRTVEHDGFLYDVGPDSFVRSKPEAEALCRELGLGKNLITPLPEGRGVYVAFGGKLHPMPEGLSLGVPTRARALASSELLSDVGKARAFLEPFVRGSTDDEESILGFLTRRMGREMAERIAAPLLAGVFAGDPERLSMQAAFPQLVDLEQSHGSLFFGLRAPRNRGVAAPLSMVERLRHLWGALVEPMKASPSPFLSLERGMGQLVEALVDELHVASSGATEAAQGLSCARINEGVEKVLVSGGRVVGVRLSGGQSLVADAVAIAGAPWSAAEILSEVEPDLASGLSGVRAAPTATVFFGFDRRKVEDRLLGSGFIVPPGEAEILASTWVDQKWPGRSPSGAGLVRAFLGGARGVGPNVMGSSDADLESVARRELERFIGPLGPLRFSRVYRYSHGTPQPELGHRARMKQVMDRLERVRGLSLIGPGYDGVGIPDCIRAAQDLATAIADGSSTSFHHL